MTPASIARSRAGFALAVGSAVAYGTNIVSAQIAAVAGISGPLLVAYRVALLLAGVLVAARIWGLPLRPLRQERWPLLTFGISCAVVGSAYLSSVAFIPVTVAAVVFYTFPVLIVFAEPLVTGRRLGSGRALLALLAFCGVALVVGPDIDRLDPRGLALATLASFGAVIQFFSANAMPRTPVLAKLAWSQAIVLPITFVILALPGGFRPFSAFADVPWAVIVTLAGFLIGFVLQLLALARIAPGSAGIIFCAEPVIAVGLAAIVLGETLGALQYAGGAIVILAIVANVRLDNRPAAAIAAQPSHP